jgi:hypothetical protein
LQDYGEMFDNFLFDLMELIKSCQFCGECNDSLLRDRIVAGVRDDLTIIKLLEQSGK